MAAIWKARKAHKKEERLKEVEAFLCSPQQRGYGKKYGDKLPGTSKIRKVPSMYTSEGAPMQ
eukprot:10116895-Alexandrium_andersonii.AAC.1